MDRLDFTFKEQAIEEENIKMHNRNSKYIHDKIVNFEIDEIESIDIYNEIYNENISKDDVEEKEVRVGRGRSTKKVKDYFRFIQMQISKKIMESNKKINDLEQERLEILMKP